MPSIKTLQSELDRAVRKEFQRNPDAAQAYLVLQLEYSDELLQEGEEYLRAKDFTVDRDGHSFRIGFPQKV